jgi:hypothetical protein
MVPEFDKRGQENVDGIVCLGCGQEQAVVNSYDEPCGSAKAEHFINGLIGCRAS